MKHKPFLLTPASKDYLWGGSRLNDDFNKGIKASPLPRKQRGRHQGESQDRGLGAVLHHPAGPL